LHRYRRVSIIRLPILPTVFLTESGYSDSFDPNTGVFLFQIRTIRIPPHPSSAIILDQLRPHQALISSTFRNRSVQDRICRSFISTRVSLTTLFSGSYILSVLEVITDYHVPLAQARIRGSRTYQDRDRVLPLPELTRWEIFRKENATVKKRT